jgi:hypothetical protein
MTRSTALITVSGSAYLAATTVLSVTQAPLGNSLFFTCVAVTVAAYAAILLQVWRAPDERNQLFTLAVLFAIAFRVPLAVAPVNRDNDMIRYLWDGRVQTLGLNPYGVVPADEALAFTHTDETREMPSAQAKTPYPPAAQLFYRLIVSIKDSSRAMKLALVFCELLTMLVVWRWLLATGRSQWLALAYAWSPLAVLEVAHSGHIDALGALWIAAAAFWISRKRTALATIAFVLAVTTKLLPIVLIPLLWRRISFRDGLLGAGLFVLLYLPFSSGADVLFGIQNVVQHVRFNGPVFRLFAALTSADGAARIALGFGLLTAAWCRWKLAADDAAAWAWPMAVAMACAPVIYPWYLLYLTPFLLSPSTLPIAVWTCGVLMTYRVWEITRAGGRWVVPHPILWTEYGSVILVGLAILIAMRLKAPAALRSTE